MNLYIGGTGGTSTPNTGTTGLTIEQLRALDEYRDLENQSAETYGEVYNLNQQFATWQGQVEQSEFNKISTALSPQRGGKIYDNNLNSGETWFRVEFQNENDAFILKAETVFVNLQANGFYNIDTEDVYFFLSPNLVSNSSRPSSFGINQNLGSKSASVFLTNTSTATRFYYVLTPVSYIGTVPFRLVII